MKGKSLAWALVIVVFLSCFVWVTHAKRRKGKTRQGEDEGGDDEAIPKTCGEYILHFVLKLLDANQKCLTGQGDSTFKLNNIFELPVRIACLLKCSLQLQGIILLDGTALDDIGSAFFFEETFPEEVREISLPEAQACFSLGGQFNVKDYWCTSYLPFIECAFRAILKGLIPYGGDCVAGPVIGILFSVLKYIAPAAPKLEAEMEELRRSVKKNKSPYTCMDSECSKMYEYKKINGSQSVIIYDKNMTVLSTELRKPTKKPK